MLPFIVILLFLLFIFILCLITFYNTYKKLLFEISLMPIPTTFEKKIEKHPLIGYSFPLIDYKDLNLANKNCVVLITSDKCSNCENSLSEVMQFFRYKNFDFLHINASKDSANEENQIYVSEIDYTYYEINISIEDLKKYNLTTFPTFILINNYTIVEVTNIAYRIQYLLETEQF